MTRAGWRLEVECAQGRGAIVLAEASAAESWHRGEGILLGWTQEKLAEVYQALTRRDDPEADSPQLG